jgi:hypothetical protein
MTVMTTIDVHGMSAEEYGRVMNRLDVEKDPAREIYLHITADTDFGFRVIEIWESEDAFNRFLQDRLAPAAEAERITREMQIRIEPLHNFFAPRLAELPALLPNLPGGPARRPG